MKYGGVSSLNKYCWRCRLLLSKDGYDILEMAYSHGDHILDNISNQLNTRYIQYNFNELVEIDSFNLNDYDKKETFDICKDIFLRYSVK